MAVMLTCVLMWLGRRVAARGICLSFHTIKYYVLLLIPHELLALLAAILDLSVTTTIILPFRRVTSSCIMSMLQRILLIQYQLVYRTVTFQSLGCSNLSDSLFFLQIICKTIAITMHYLFLVSFCWMALEGIVLYLLLVKIFRSKTRPARDRAVFLLCGWGKCSLE